MIPKLNNRSATIDNSFPALIFITPDPPGKGFIEVGCWMVFYLKGCCGKVDLFFFKI